MPIYEYQCAHCGSHAEVLVPLAPSTPYCPTCGKPLTEKLVSAPNFLRRTGSERAAGRTCCGREERCETPPCSAGGGCRR
jgi:putative FmdB family regulatory protein